MIAKIKTLAAVGVDVHPINCEASITNGMPMFNIVGMAEKSIQESRERVRVVLKELESYDEDIIYPVTRITLNLAPADVIKKGNQFDVAIIISLLVAQDYLNNKVCDDIFFLGEVNLDGTIKRVNNIISYILYLNEFHPKSKIFIPNENIKEAELITDGNVFGFSTISSIISHLKNIKVNDPIARAERVEFTQNSNFKMEDIIGQTLAKRAIEIAAAGGHNLLMIGEQGSGKTLIARTMETILPPLSKIEMLEVAKIKSMVGMSDNEILSFNRPFRSPHHTSSTISILGGGNKVTPGEITLAHRGVLFLDELTEYDRRLLDSLRQPLEDRFVSISRVSGKVRYPASFQLIATMNPSFEGGFNNKKIEENKGFRKISGPILDRFDLQLQIFKPLNSEIVGKIRTDTTIVRNRILKAIEIQSIRFDSKKRNAEMSISDMDKFCCLDPISNTYLLDYKEKKNLSMRGFHKILKVARTIADLDSKDVIEKRHIIEASQFRIK